MKRKQNDEKTREIARNLTPWVEGLEDAFSDCPYAKDVEWDKLMGTLFWKVIYSPRRGYHDCLDLLSEVVVRLLLKKEKVIAYFRGEGSFGGYLYHILRIYVITIVRMRKNAPKMIHLEDMALIGLLEEINGSAPVISETRDPVPRRRISWPSFAPPIENFDEGILLLSEFQDYLTGVYKKDLANNMCQLCEWIVDGGTVANFSVKKNMNRTRAYRMYRSLRVDLSNFLNRGTVC